MDENNYKKDKMTIPEIISLSFSVYKNKFKLIAIMMVLLYLPIIIVQYYLADRFLTDKVITDITQAISIDKIPNEAVYNMFPYMVSVLLLGLCSIIPLISVIIITLNYINKEPAGINDILNRSFSFWLKAVFTKIIASVLIFVGLMLCILPGLYYYILFAFISYVVVVKGIWGLKALRYSANLIKNNFLKVAGLAILVFIFEYMLMIAIESINSFINIGIKPIDFSISVIFGLISQIILSIITIIFTVAFYNIDSTTNPGINK